MEIKDYVIEKVSPEDYYQSRFPSWNKHNRPNVRCPFHEDGGTPNLSVGLHNGGAHCHSAQCGKRIGNIVHFEAEIKSISELKAANNLYREFLGPFIEPRVIKQYHHDLIQNKKYVDLVKESMGLNRQGIVRYSLGLDISSNRITIPIFDRYGYVTNIRYYALPEHRTAKTVAKIYNQKGCSGVELFSWIDFKRFDSKYPLFWMKAEKDTMLACSLGLQAFCLINGEGTWKDNLPEIVKEFNVYICGDNDEAGVIASEKRLAKLQETGNKIYKNLKLPTQLKDFADWILKDNGTTAKLLSLIKPKIKLGEARLPPSENYTLCTPEFQDLYAIARNSKFLNKVVRVRGIVSGKSDRTYSVPSRFIVHSTTGIRPFQVSVGRELLRFVRSTDEDIRRCVKSLIRNSQAKIEIDPDGVLPVSELEIIPAISPEFDTPYVTQKCFYVGKSIEANIPYELHIMPTTEIRSQETVGIIVKAIPLNPVEFNLNYNSDKLTCLETFRSQGNIYEWISQIAESVSLHHTKIFNRVDWHLVALLSWACPLEYHFPNEGIQRGWFNSLAIGDTKTGKSEVVLKVRELLCAGTFVSSENCTLVGLLGGAIHNASGGFWLRWGKIPLNHRSLVIVEEMSGLSIHAISNLSDVRSSGKARLDKGGISSETHAKTRLIFLSNVRGRGRSLSSYISGVRAIEDLIGHSEDISRFDLISTLTVKEVGSDIINAPRDYVQPTIANLAELRTLIRFIWALTPEHIEITNEAYHLCLTRTKEFGKIYHPSIPLFDVGSGRLKISRIAVAIACFCFNWHNQKIIVEATHIEAACALLQTLFDKPSCGYREYSDQMFYRETIEGETALNQTVANILIQNKRQAFMKYIVHAAKFTVDEIAAVAGIQTYPANTILGHMISGNVIRKGEANTWELTPIGKAWAEQNMNGDIKQIKTIKKTKLWGK